MFQHRKCRYKLEHLILLLLYCLHIVTPHVIRVSINGDDDFDPHHPNRMPYTVEVPYPVKTLDEIIKISCGQLPIECHKPHLRDASGSVITKIESIQPDQNFYLLNDHDLWIWPTHYLGKTHQVILTSANGRKNHISIKTLSRRPRVFEVPDFLSTEECDHLISLGKPYLLKSENVKSVANLRTSSMAALIGAELNSDAVIMRIRKRIMELTRLPQFNVIDSVEAFQVVRYREGEHYGIHLDSHHIQHITDDKFTIEPSRRFISIFVYLNNDFEDGHTIFPYAESTKNYTQFDQYVTMDCENEEGIRYRGKKGSALMFYCLTGAGYLNNTLDKYHLHGGCKVTSGVKWAANIWIKNKGFYHNGKVFLVRRRLAKEEL